MTARRPNPAPFNARNRGQAAQANANSHRMWHENRAKQGAAAEVDWDAAIARLKAMLAAYDDLEEDT